MAKIIDVIVRYSESGQTDALAKLNLAQEKNLKLTKEQAVESQKSNVATAESKKRLMILQKPIRI